LTYSSFESKILPSIQTTGEIYFTKFKIGLNQFGVFLQFLQKKSEKKKRMELEKKKEAEG
jgi:hypothetical protein